MPDAVFQRPDRRFALALVAVVTALAMLPAALGALFPPEGTSYTGLHVNSPGDYPVYYANIAYAEDGHLLIADLFTSEKTREYPNLFWTTWGLAAAPFQLDPRVVFQIARFITIPVSVFVWLWALKFWIPESSRWRWASAFLCVAGGVGYLLALWQGAHGIPPAERTLPMDIWVSEGFNGITLLHSPHMVAASALLFAALTLLARSLSGGRPRDAAVAGGFVSILGLFHPFHLVTLAVVPVAAVVAITLKERRFPVGSLGRLVRFGLAALPGAAVYAVLVLTDPTTGQRFAQNQTATPPLPITLVSYGFLVPFALLGAWKRWRRGDRASVFLTAWFVAHALLLYAPLAFQRRLTQGFQFPLAMLAFDGLVVLYAWLIRTVNFRRLLVGAGSGPLIGLLVTLAFGMSLLTVYASEFTLVLRPQAHSLGSAAFLPKDEVEAYRWLRSNSPKDAVTLGTVGTGLFSAGLSGRRTYVAHFVETLNFKEKIPVAEYFFRGMSSAERRDLLRSNSITYVIETQRERSLGSVAHEAFATAVYTGPTTAVFRVAP